MGEQEALSIRECTMPGFDFIVQIPVFGAIIGFATSLLMNYLAHPLDEVCAIIAGLLVIKGAMCLIPPPVQRYDEDGKPYYLHRRNPMDRNVEAVFGYGFSAIGVGYTAPLTMNSHPAFALQTVASAVVLYFIYTKRVVPDLVLTAGKKKKA